MNTQLTRSLTLALTTTLGLATASIVAWAGPRLAEGENLTLGFQHTIHSELLGEMRTFRVSVPDTYSASDRSYPVLLALDGESYPFLTTTAAASFLASISLAPEAIVVALHNTQRERDMTPSDLQIPGMPEGRAELFLDFFEQELFPFIEEHYRAQPFRVLIGHSHGGILGLHALAARPDLIRWHLSIDTPVRLVDEYQTKKLAGILADSPEYRGRLVSVQAKGGWTESAWSHLVATAPPGFRAERILLSDEGHESVAFNATYLGLKSLFHDYSVDENRRLPLAELQAEFRALSDNYGFDAIPSRRTLSILAGEHMVAGFGEEARKTLEYAVAMHGAFPGSSPRLAAARTLELAGPPKETVESMLAMPRANAAALAPYLGEWVGHFTGQDMIVSFVADGALVTSTTEFIRPDGTRTGYIHDNVVLQVPGEGQIAWGYINGRRPRGVLYYDAELSAEGTLMGAVTMRGVKFEVPDDVDTSFVFRRLE